MDRNRISSKSAAQREESLVPKKIPVHLEPLNNLNQTSFNSASWLEKRKPDAHDTKGNDSKILSDADIIESLSWTKTLDKFLKKPSISDLLVAVVCTKQDAAKNDGKAALTSTLSDHDITDASNSRSFPRMIEKNQQRFQRVRSIKMQSHAVPLDAEFLKHVESADQILNLAAHRRISQHELEDIRSFTRGSSLISGWEEDLNTAFDHPMTNRKSNRRLGRRSALQLPQIVPEIPLPIRNKAEFDQLPQLSQRSDISVPAYLFDEDTSSKLLPDFSRIEKRRIFRQRESELFGAASLLAPNPESDSDPCSDDCDGFEKERVSYLNAHKPTIISAESGIETVDHDELNAYSDFAYAASYQKIFASEMASKFKKSSQPKNKSLFAIQEKEENESRISVNSKNKLQEDVTGMPDVSNNWKTSMMISNVAASEYCRFCHVYKLPMYHTIIRASLTHSHHKNVSFAGENVRGIAHYFKHAAKSIEELMINSCSVGNVEIRYLGASCFTLMSSLRSLKLIDCNFGDSAEFLHKNLAMLSSLTSIELSNCKLRDTDCASALKGLAESNSKCTRICLDHNFASAASADIMAKCFRYSKCTWQEVNLSWNRMSPSWIMCSSMRHCDSLTAINLSWNGLRDEIALSAMCYALRFHIQMRHINLQNCGLEDRHALLLSELLRDCVSLVSMDLRNNSIHAYGCRSILRVLGLRHQSWCDQALNQGEVASKSGICNVMLPISGTIPDSLIDYDAVAGPMEFSLRIPSDRHIIRYLMEKKKKGLVAFTNDTFQFNGKDMPAATLLNIIETADTRVMHQHQDVCIINDLQDIKNHQQFDYNLDGDKIFLTIQSLIQYPTEDRLATVWEIEFVKQIHASQDFSVEQKMFFVCFLLGGSNVFKLQQLQEMIFLIKPGYRVDAVKLALTHCWERNCSEKILSWLSTSEQNKVQMHVSEECLHFAPNNPTGHYRLMLSSRFDRDICLKLLAIRNDTMDIIKRDKAYQSSRHKVEMVALNVKFEGIPFTLTPDWCIPSNGTLELDFVYCVRPNPTAFPLIDDQYVFEFTLAPISNQRKQLKLLRSLSNEHYFTCTQAMRIMQYFHDDAMKVESLVILYSRVIDYPGFMRVVKTLDGNKQVALRKKLGAHNLYSDCTAVGFHELDLTDPQQRFVCGRLVDLAIIEPGENMCACRYNEIDFDVPSSWLDDIPQKGIFSVFYCRSTQVIKKIYQKIPPECVPSNLDLISPAGTEWVQQAKRVRIKLKLSLAFTNVEEAFNKMDEDGGGSLSRLEFSRGLRMLGVQVTAYELLDLVDLLDEDGSGFIELEEMVSFWESC